jgi:hypothetical protein
VGDIVDNFRSAVVLCCTNLLSSLLLVGGVGDIVDNFRSAVVLCCTNLLSSLLLVGRVGDAVDNFRSAIVLCCTNPLSSLLLVRGVGNTAQLADSVLAIVLCCTDAFCFLYVECVGDTVDNFMSTIVLCIGLSVSVCFKTNSDRVFCGIRGISALMLMPSEAGKPRGLRCI